jgi:hypothetical protein
MVTVSDQHLLYQSQSRFVLVVQPQLKVLYMLATHPSSEDDEYASGSSSKGDDVLGHGDDWGWL